MLMFLGEIEDNRPLACLTQQVDPHKIMKHPPRRVLLQEWLVICYNELDSIDPRSSETGYEWFCPV